MNGSLCETPPESRNVKYVTIEKLTLDLESPRFPESAGNWSPAETIDYLHREFVLDEIINSMLDNGFFRHEALVILSKPDPKSRRHIVLDGNRRLAALMYIHGTVEDYLPDPPPTEEQLDRLTSIPCIEVGSREEIRAFLGFQHISGIKDWSPEAKARFIALDVDRLASEDHSCPFESVGRAHGTNAQAVRDTYLAILVLQYAKNHFDLRTDYVQNRRFGIWHRCLSASMTRQFLGLESPRRYEDVHAALGRIDRLRLKRILDDLTPETARSRPLIHDARLLSKYCAVLSSDRARNALERYRDLDLATQCLKSEGINASR